MFFHIPELSTACVMLMSDFLLPGGAWDFGFPFEAGFRNRGKSREEGGRDGRSGRRGERKGEKKGWLRT